MNKVKNKTRFQILIVPFLIVSFVVFPNFSFAAENNVKCFPSGYTIATINGVFTGEDGARDNMVTLKKEVGRKLGIIKNPITNEEEIFYTKSETKQKEILNFIYLLNPTHLAGLGDFLKSLEQKSWESRSKYFKDSTFEDYDTKEMWKTMSDTLTTQKLLMIGHSQGNFYTNGLYDHIVNKKGGISEKSMSVYAVATPSDHVAGRVAGNENYTTSSTDKVINGLVKRLSKNPLKANVDIVLKDGEFLGHEFAKVYLKDEKTTEKIITDIKESLNNLKEDTDQDSQKSCIDGPELGFIHTVTGLFFTVTDPLANVVKETTKNIVILPIEGAKNITDIAVNTVNTVKTVGSFIIETGVAFVNNMVDIVVGTVKLATHTATTVWDTGSNSFATVWSAVGDVFSGSSAEQVELVVKTTTQAQPVSGQNELTGTGGADSDLIIETSTKQVEPVVVPQPITQPPKKTVPLTIEQLEKKIVEVRKIIAETIAVSNGATDSVGQESSHNAGHSSNSGNNTGSTPPPPPLLLLVSGSAPVTTTLPITSDETGATNKSDESVKLVDLKPTISLFTAVSASLKSDDPVIFSWVYSGATPMKLAIDDGVNKVFDATAEQVSHLVNIATIKVSNKKASYTLTATNSEGTVSKTTTVEIREVLDNKKSIVINEIAWMGSKDNPTDEWIELYNPADQEIDLTNFKLETPDNSVTIEFTESYQKTIEGAVWTNKTPVIKAKSYFLLRKYHPQTSGETDWFFLGNLNDQDETKTEAERKKKEGLALKIDNKIIDQVDFWYSGQNYSTSDKLTMERISSFRFSDDIDNWKRNDQITFNGQDISGGIIYGTPKRQNSLISVINGGYRRDMRFYPYPEVIYLVYGFTLNSGFTLTIDPGAVIKMSSNPQNQGRMMINGDLIAIGSPEKKIYITSDKDKRWPKSRDLENNDGPEPQPGDWGSIYLRGSKNSILKHVEISYGGGVRNSGVIGIEGSQVTIENVLIDQSKNGAIKMHNCVGDASLNLSSSIIKNIQGPVINFHRFRGETVNAEITNNTFENNEHGIVDNYVGNSVMIFKLINNKFINTPGSDEELLKKFNEMAENIKRIIARDLALSEIKNIKITELLTDQEKLTKVGKVFSFIKDVSEIQSLLTTIQVSSADSHYYGSLLLPLLGNEIKIAEKLIEIANDTIKRDLVMASLEGVKLIEVVLDAEKLAKLGKDFLVFRGYLEVRGALQKMSVPSEVVSRYADNLARVVVTGDETKIIEKLKEVAAEVIRIAARDAALPILEGIKITDLLTDAEKLTQVVKVFAIFKYVYEAQNGLIKLGVPSEIYNTVNFIYENSGFIGIFNDEVKITDKIKEIATETNRIAARDAGLASLDGIKITELLIDAEKLTQVAKVFAIFKNVSEAQNGLIKLGVPSEIYNTSNFFYGNSGFIGIFNDETKIAEKLKEIANEVIRIAARDAGLASLDGIKITELLTDAEKLTQVAKVFAIFKNVSEAENGLIKLGVSSDIYSSFRFRYETGGFIGIFNDEVKITEKLREVAIESAKIGG